MTWIQTLDGGIFNLESPAADSVNAETLAVVLARKCRFGGHCNPFYSVAQHSLLVCDLVSEPALKLEALLHDAHEAYSGFGDVLRPAKYLRKDIADFLNWHEWNIDRAVAEYFGATFTLMRHISIRRADDIALATEARDLMTPPPQPWVNMPDPHFERIEPMSIDESYRQFIARLHELKRR